MKLVWKLLRQHLSIGQFTGFFIANLFGMLIILTGIQLYNDAYSLISGDDGLFKKDFIVISKRINTLSVIGNKRSDFTPSEVDDLKKQNFVRNTAPFTSSQFEVSGNVNMMSGAVNMTTDMFFESIPDTYIDVKSEDWVYDAHSSFVPIIVPKNYLNLYNFGFAQSKQMPQLSEGLVGMVTINIRIRGNFGKSLHLKGKIVGFSNRINTILVPETFMNEMNKEFGDKKEVQPSRLIVEVKNPSDPAVLSYMNNNGYEVEGNDLESGKASYFLKVLVSIVVGVGLLISLLSFFILMLSIYLLLQKNTQKLENLLMIGYGERAIAKPYQILTVCLNAGVWVVSVIALFFIRKLYIQSLTDFFPHYEQGTFWQAVIAGFLFFVIISLINCIIIRRKVSRIGIG